MTWTELYMYLYIYIFILIGINERFVAVLIHKRKMSKNKVTKVVL